ncbi:MAG: proteasome assembly chaperone family protein [Thermoguttaceae bacterium]|jgi:proteasome assembly chaperone (PAC2) family protein
MPLPIDEILQIRRPPSIDRATLVLAFTGWMDGGDVSSGTVQRLVDLLGAEPIAEINPEPFYIYNIPGPMEVASIFRPHVEVSGGLLKKIEMPTNRFYCHEPANLVLFVGKEPNLHWHSFGECIFRFARQTGIEKILFVGSFGGSVPHTREPRLFITCSDASLLAEMEPYGVRRSDYEGPGSFTNYLMAQAASAGLQMVSLVAEIPGYLQGANPPCIAAVTRRLAKILRLSLDSDALRTVSTEWELQVSSIVEQDEELAHEVRRLEEEYDYDLLKSEPEGPGT